MLGHYYLWFWLFSIRNCEFSKCESSGNLKWQILNFVLQLNIVLTLIRVKRLKKVTKVGKIGYKGNKKCSFTLLTQPKCQDNLIIFFILARQESPALSPFNHPHLKASSTTATLTTKVYWLAAFQRCMLPSNLSICQPYEGLSYHCSILYVMYHFLDQHKKDAR